MSELPTLTITAAPDPNGPDPIREFAARHIGNEEFVEIEVVYTGHETAPDILRVNRAGEIVAARSADDA